MRRLLEEIQHRVITVIRMMHKVILRHNVIKNIGPCQRLHLVWLVWVIMQEGKLSSLVLLFQ